MKISVIIPTLGRNTLKDTLKSLAEQTLKPFEILIIDTSKNKKAKLFKQKYKQLPIKYFFLKGKSPSCARNQGIQQAKGGVLVFLDDDCLPKKTWLKEFSKSIFKGSLVVQGGINPSYLKKNFWSKILSYFEEKYYDSSIFQSDHKRKNYFVKYLISCNFAIKKKTLFEHNLFFDEKNFPYFGCDTDLGIRIRKKGIKISYDSKAEVIHCFEKTDFLKVLIRRFKRGMEGGRTQAKYRNLIKQARKYETFFPKEEFTGFKKTENLSFKILIDFFTAINFLGKLYGRLDFKLRN